MCCFFTVLSFSVTQSTHVPIRVIHTLYVTTKQTPTWRLLDGQGEQARKDPGFLDLLHSYRLSPWGAETDRLAHMGGEMT